MSSKKIAGTDEAWDTRALGAEVEFAIAIEGTGEALIDTALELQPISIRLQKSLIEDFKHIAQLHGIGYQPLMRQVLTRFANGEKKRLLREAAARSVKRRPAAAEPAGEAPAPRTGTGG